MRRIEFGPFALDLDTFELRRLAKLVGVQRRVFDFLVYLIAHRERVVSSEELLSRLWAGATVTPGALARVVRLARIALEDDAEQPAWIATMRGRGYRFIGTLGESEKSDDAHPASAPWEETIGQVPLLGREAELSRLLRALASVERGAGQICLLSGEPGIGKTRLASDAVQRARSLGFEVLDARCHDGEGAPAYWPWIQLLRAHARTRSSAELRVELGPAAAIVGRYVPELGASGTKGDDGFAPAPEAARFHFFDHVVRLFQASASRRPLVLWIDDLHWADGPSLRLLQFLAGEIVGTSLLVLAAHRTSELDVSPLLRELLPQLARHSHCERLILSGLSQGAVRELVAQLRGSSAPAADAEVEEIHRRTAGNPFYVRELLGSEKLAGTALPAAIRELLGSRLGRLSSDCQTLLRAAAIAGTEWRSDLALAVAALSGAAASRALQEAVAAELIRPMPAALSSHRFVHALVRETVYAALSPGERVQLHRRALEWLECRGEADAEELAHHALACADADRRHQALRYCIRAGDAGMRKLAYESGVHHYARALELLGLDAEASAVLRCELLVRLGEAEMAAGNRARATEALWSAAHLARELRSGMLLARAALGLSPGLLSLEFIPMDTEFVALLRDALGLCAGDPELSSRLLARLALARMPSADAIECEPLVAQAIDLARAADLSGAELFARAARHWIRWGPANLAERIKETEELVDCASRSGERQVEVLCRTFRLCALLEAGNLPALRLELEAFERMASAFRQPQALWQRVMFRATLAQLEGNYADAVRLRDEYLRIGASVGDLNALHAAGAFNLLLAWEQGRCEDGLELAQQFTTVHDAWRVGIAHMLAECGRLQESGALLRELCAEPAIMARQDALWQTLMTALCETCAVVQDEQAAQTLHTALLPYRDRVTVVGYAWGCWGSLERNLGDLCTVMGAWERAEDHFERAILANRRLGARALVARTQYLHARMLRLRDAPGDRARSDELVTAALPAAARLGLVTVGARLRELAGS